MTAAEHNIIIEKGADFRLHTQVTEGIGKAKDILGWTIELRIKRLSSSGAIEFMNQTGRGFSLTDSAFTATGDADGKFTIVIDKAVTAEMATGLPEEVSNKFATEYMYMYSVDINKPLAEDGTETSANVENTRVLRGRCAIRE